MDQKCMRNNQNEYELIRSEAKMIKQPSFRMSFWVLQTLAITLSHKLLMVRWNPQENILLQMNVEFSYDWL